MKILISAAETSSDIHGAQLLRSLKKKYGEVDAFGMGGEQLQAEGLRSLVDSRELLSMGFSEILGRLPRIVESLGILTEAAKKEQPQIAVVIDYPDFHFQLARRLNRLGVPVIYFIPPKVWAWRKYRLRTLRQRFHQLLTILPFEEPFYREQGIPATYVGNPLLDELPTQVSQQEARESLGISSDEIVLTLMPGSRPKELEFLIRPVLDTAQAFAQKLGRRVKALMPLPAGSEAQRDYCLAAFEQWKKSHAPLFDLEASIGNSHLCMLASDTAAIKSGTSTLEAALLGCPHVVLYDTSRLTRFIFFKVIRYQKAVGLSNLVFDFNRTQKPFLFREYLGEEVVPEIMAEELLLHIGETDRLREIRSGIEKIRERIYREESPSDRAATEVMVAANRPVQPIVPAVPQGALAIGSFLWSALNAFVRLLVRSRVMKPMKIRPKVVSVGNLEAGGTGKTPVVAQIAREGIERGKTVCILTRGYRSHWERRGGVLAPNQELPDVEDCGDEVALLHGLVPEAWIGVGSDRLKQYHEVTKRTRNPIDLVILDDGFQHWKIRKDVELLAVTSSDRRDRLHREFSRAAETADLLVWTKGDRPPSGLSGPMVRMEYELPQSNEAIWLIMGLGNPQEARRTVELAGYEVRHQVTFPDHADYSESTVRSLVRQARADGCRVAVTGKDWVKWKRYSKPEDETIVLEPRLKLREGEELWNRVLWP